MIETTNHIGVDFGANLAGTTAIAFFGAVGLEVVQSIKGKPAFEFMLNFAKDNPTQMVCIDAPLSLPAAFYQRGTDYFFRQCDRELRAMSPMFLGGLTANAMRLSGLLQQMGIHVKEVYPAAIVREFPDLERLYDKKSKTISDFSISFSSLTGIPIKSNIQNWHQMDAILAWYSGYRLLRNQAKIVGDPTEGLIII